MWKIRVYIRKRTNLALSPPWTVRTPPALASVVESSQVALGCLLWHMRSLKHTPKKKYQLVLLETGLKIY